MSTKKGLYEKAKGEMRFSERILAELPGFRGYKEKELRRESDKLVRNHLYLKMSQARSIIKEVFQQLSEKRLQEVLTDMDHLIAEFDRTAEKINHASYGYAGFFNVLKIEEEKLDSMTSFDNQLIDKVTQILEEAKAFKAEIVKQKTEKTREHIQKLNTSLDSLEETFDERQETILGVK